ncbi:hypothetical protein ASZ90_007579 [hydrocarbon metagenome]|uniref:Uncharacterized protein n=1 Tax=hydrocarbon metagenome TaxID=938273 RepID=A0A0W8FNZ2_9ZZZZ
MLKSKAGSTRPCLFFAEKSEIIAVIPAIFWRESRKRKMDPRQARSGMTKVVAHSGDNS